MEANPAQTRTGNQPNGRPGERIPGREPVKVEWQARVEEIVRKRPAATLVGCFVFGFMLGMWTRR